MSETRERVSRSAIQRVVSQDNKLYIQTNFADDYALERNKQIKAAALLDKAKFNLHDGEDIRMIISCPDTLQWTLFKRDHKETYKLILSRREEERMKGCRQLQILHPEWVIQERL